MLCSSCGHLAPHVTGRRLTSLLNLGYGPTLDASAFPTMLLASAWGLRHYMSRLEPGIGLLSTRVKKYHVVLVFNSGLACWHSCGTVLGMSR
jgi:hypothetical protein